MPKSNRAFKNGMAFLASLELTVGLLVLSVVFVFAATLDQVHLGVWGVQEKYFHTFFVMAKVPGAALRLPVFPGGYLLGAALLANLVAAHCLRFRLTWRKSGIWLTHAGFILLIAGEGLSGLFQQDEQMRLDVGQTGRYAESARDYELAVVDASNPGFDQVVAIPSGLLKGADPIQEPELPFLVVPHGYFPNATVRMRGQGDGSSSVATQGAGPSVVMRPVPVTTKDDEANWPAAYVELKGPEGSLGTWLVSTVLGQPQSFSYGGRAWRLALRPRRDYLPFSLTLEKFTHDVYPGSDIPKNFASTLRIRQDGGRADRRVVVYMNNPLRYGGRAFYQAGYDNNDRTTVLQVVRNPGWTIPYLACGLMGVGLAVQFCMHLFGFFRRRAGAAQGVGSPAERPKRLGDKALHLA